MCADGMGGTLDKTSAGALTAAPKAASRVGRKAGGGPGEPAHARRRHQQARWTSGLVTVLLLGFAAGAALLYANMRHDGEQPALETVAAAAPAPGARVRKIDPVAAARFARPAAASCDGRLRCSQMNSCAEAKYFLANCPSAAAEMDSNLNGIPCDTQWCTAGAAHQGVR